MLGRRVSAGGRTSAFVQGRSATAADLRELGGRLVSFLGQHEHRRLTVAAAQLEVLDAFCGPEHLELRAAYLEAHERARACRRELEELRARAGARERDLDLLVFEIGEIEELEPTEAEHESLTAERDRLRHLEALRGAAGGAGGGTGARVGRGRGRRADGLGRGAGRGPRGGRPRAGRAGGPAARAADRGRRRGGRAAPLRRGPGGRARAAGGGGDAARALRPAAAKARRVGGQRAGAPRALRGRARPAGGRRGGRRGAAGRAGRGGASARSGWPASCRRPGAKRSPRWRSGCSTSCRGWRSRTPPSPPSCARARSWGPTAPRASSSCWPPTAACRPRRCARPRPEASCRG